MSCFSTYELKISIVNRRKVGRTSLSKRGASFFFAWYKRRNSFIAISHKQFGPHLLTLTNEYPYWRGGLKILYLYDTKSYLLCWWKSPNAWPISCKMTLLYMHVLAFKETYIQGKSCCVQLFMQVKKLNLVYRYVFPVSIYLSINYFWSAAPKGSMT